MSIVMKDWDESWPESDEWPDRDDPENWLECWGCNKMIYCCDMMVDHKGLCVNCYNKLRKSDGQ